MSARCRGSGIALVVVPVVLFGLTLRGLGLAPILVVVVLATAWASRYASLRASVPLALGIAAFCSLLFIKGLGLPLPLVGPWLSRRYWRAPPTAAAAPHPRHRAGAVGARAMELLANLGLGFETALSPWNLLYCFIGVLLGTAVGRAAGPGADRHHRHAPAAHLRLPPVSALIMLAGIYYGAQYGGSTTAILINLPGESPPRW